jgi:hypothetical protein
VTSDFQPKACYAIDLFDLAEVSFQSFRMIIVALLETSTICASLTGTCCEMTG